MILQELQKVSKKLKNEIALIDENEKVTYQELFDYSKKVANKLARLNVCKGDFVTIELSRNKKYFASMFGTWMVNAAFAALDNSYPSDRLDFVAEDCKAKVRITDSFFDDIYNEPLLENIIFPKENDYSLLVYTSGSTGRPKGVLHTHLSMHDMTVRGKIGCGFNNLEGKGYIMGLPIPLSFIAGISVSIGAFLDGVSVYIIPYSALRDPQIMSKIIYENNISLAYIPPKMIKVFENKNHVLKTILTGSEKLTNTYRDDCDIYNCYGSSEIGGGVTFFKVDKEYENTPIGNVVSIEKIHILDDNNKEANEGELCIAGHFALGYYNLEEETKEHFIPNPFKEKDGFDILYRTGDIVKRLGDGNLVYLNRKDWMIKINGQRVEPGEIEETIRKVNGILDCAVKDFVGAAEQTYITAYYSLKSGADVKEEEIKKIIKDNLPSYMMPAYFIKLDKLPTNANGKLDRKALKAPELATNEYIAPRTEEEKILCAAFEKALNIPRIGIKDDFFLLGGDSIRVMVLEQLCPELKLSTKMIYEKRTVEAIAEAVKNNKEELDLNVDIYKDSFPLNQAQLGIFLSCEQREGEIAYNNPILLKFKHSVDEKKLQKAINTVIKNHPGLLATIYIDQDGLPKMRYSEEFASLEGCEIQYIEEKNFKKIKRKLIQPFYIKKDRLFRFRIFKSEEAIHLFMDIHHVMFDGYSMKVLLPEIIDLYNGKDIAPETFTAYHACLKEAKERESEGYKNAKDWYLKEFADVEEISLPQGDRKDKEINFKEYKTNLNVDFELIKEFCYNNQLTENAFTTAAFGTLLSLYTMNRKAAFATVYNGRHDISTARTVSMFVRTLPVLCQNEPTIDVVSYIKNVKNLMFGSMANDAFSFMELASNSGYTSEVLFTYQGDLFELPNCGELTAIKENLPFNATGEKLSIQVFPINNKLVFDVQYYSNLYSEKWIKDFTKYYQAVLNSFLNVKLLKDVSLLSKKEEIDNINASYGGTLDYDKNKTFIDMFLDQAKKHPNKDAVIDSKSSYKYYELDNASNKIAHYLISHGIKKGEFIALKVNRVKEFYAGVVGVEKAGCGYVPVDPTYPLDRIEYMIEDSEAKIVLTEDLIRKIIEEEKDDSSINLATPYLPAYMIYTSGSTGKPKGVVITHEGLSCFLAWQIADYDLSDKNVHAQHASFSFDASVMDIFPPLATGAKVHVLDEVVRKDLDLTYKYLVDNKVTNLCMSTQIGMSLINLHPDVPLKFLLIGGEKFLQVAKTNVKIYNGYGPTEFTVCSSYQLVDQNSDKDVPIGKAVRNTYSFICDYNGNLLPLGMVGEICLVGPQLSVGYYHREELNKERFIDCSFLKGNKMYKTGDLAKYNEDGVMEYSGRIDFQVKLRGFRIELGEIENVASSYKGITQSIALVKNKLLVLYYVGDTKISEDDLKAHMASSLTEYMVPNIYIQLDKMPLTPGGKIDRKALPEPENKIGNIVAPRNDEEQIIFDLLVKILGYDEFGVLDDFKNIGLTSLSAMQFASLLSTAMNKTVRVSDLVNYPTIAQIAAFMSGKSVEKEYEIQQYYPLTMCQKGILTEVLAHPETTIYNIPSILDLPKSTDLNKFENAVIKAIDAHPYLKARIVSNDNNFIVERNDDLEVSVTRVPLSSLKEGPQDLVRPFDLLNNQLFRAYLLTSDEGNKFLFDAHHIIFDGESLDVLLNDINKSYLGEEISKETYTEYEYALDEVELREGDSLKVAKEYYGNLLDGKDTDSILVNDVSLTGIGKKIINFNTKIDINRVDIFIKDNKTTINSLWIASIGYALAKYLSREDAIFTTVYNGRNDTRIHQDVGMFVHTLPIVVEPFKSSNAIDFVKSVGEQIQLNMAHDIYSFMEIAHDYGVRADLLFVYEGKISQGAKLGGEDIKNATLLSTNEPKADILIAVSDIDDGFNIQIEYDGNKYEEWSLDSFINSVIRVFNALINNEDITNIPLLSDKDYKKIDEYNNTNVDIVRDDIVSEFTNMANKFPDNIAVIFKNKKYTYAEVDKISNKIAYFLASKGIKRGDVVSIIIPRNEYMPISALGVLKTGAAYQPLDYTYPEDRLLFMIKDANAKYLIADEELIKKIPECDLPALFTKDIPSLSEDKVKLTNPDKDSLFILLYTSGTTGTPKGVMLSHLNLVNFAAWYRKFYDLKPGNVVSAYAGFGFDACMMDIYPALTTGAAVCVVPDELRMNLDQLANYYTENNVTHSFMTTQVGRLFAAEGYKSTLKYLSVGGEKLTPLTPPTDYKLYNGYGPTECTIFTTAYLVDKMYHRIPIGKPLDNYKLYVVDNKGQQLPNGALGELWISGLGVGLGYLNLKEKTEQTFIKNPFSNDKDYQRIYRTGDIVRRLGDGTIDFIGRNDGQVKIRGFRIELGEVEMVIRSFAGIKDVTVQAFDLEAGGKFLAAYFTSDKKIDINELKKHIKDNKPAYMVPASIMQIDAIPLNQNQKVNKRALPKPSFTEEDKVFVEASNVVEKVFCDAYKEILGLDRVSATDSFFDIGGTSLTAAKVVIFALNNGYQVSYQDIFAHPSPRDLAEFIKDNKTEAPKESAEDFERDIERDSLKYNDVKYVDEIKKDRDLGKVLLAGATGFLGIHLFKELLDQKREMIILVRARGIDPVERMKGLLMYYFDSPLEEEFNKYVKVINADITEKNLLSLLEEYEFDTIINAAAIVKHFANDDSIERVNVGGVKNLIEVAKARKVRFVQVSTLSVAGENVDHKFPDNYLMKENQLYFGQDLTNKYANSKFKAEEAILDAVEKDNLDAKIIRVGNLMSRQTDGEFQINSVTNNFMRNLKGYKVLEKFPVSALDKSVDFSPIDETAKTILLLAQVPEKFTVFHSFNSHSVQMGDVIDAMNEAGLHADKVNDMEFMMALKEAMSDEKKSMIVSSLLSYSTSDNLSHEFIGGDATFTIKALYRLGYRWPITDFDYLIKAIKSLDSLGYFDRDDM
ncbi:MAG: amino acid adenylation domain-containing protein [Acholeplasmatales bacterium]|nr:amino acid adenylation domain-containing protein [Acholeplasmatales bacterium]